MAALLVVGITGNDRFPRTVVELPPVSVNVKLSSAIKVVDVLATIIIVALVRNVVTFPVMTVVVEFPSMTVVELVSI